MVQSNVAGDGAAVCIDNIGAWIGGHRSGCNSGGCGGVDGLFFGGVDVGALRMNVAHGGGFGSRCMLHYLLGGECWPGIKVASVNGVGPGGKNRGE